MECLLPLLSKENKKIVSKKTIMENAKRDYFVERLNNCKDNIKKTRKIVNSLLSKPNRNKNCQLFWTVAVQRFMILGMSLIMFCDHFSTKADTFESAMPRTDKESIEFMPEPVSESVAPTAPASVEEVKKLILSLQD